MSFRSLSVFSFLLITLVAACAEYQTGRVLPAPTSAFTEIPQIAHDFDGVYQVNFFIGEHENLQGEVVITQSAFATTLSSDSVEDFPIAGKLNSHGHILFSNLGEDQGYRIKAYGKAINGVILGNYEYNQQRGEFVGTRAAPNGDLGVRNPRIPSPLD